jgi:hypothetical protein
VKKGIVLSAAKEKICRIPAAAGSADIFGCLFLFIGDDGVTA